MPKTISVAALLLAAIILPVQFSKDLANGKSSSILYVEYLVKYLNVWLLLWGAVYKFK